VGLGLNPGFPACTTAAITCAMSVEIETLRGHPGLVAYAGLLEKWQARINLVGPKTLPELWQRHMLDSAQLLPLLPEGACRLADLGSGAGFPGLVLAILRPDIDVHLLESDQRKCAFLSTVAREAGAKDTIHNKRIEAVEPLRAAVVTARALASLTELIGYAQRHLAQAPEPGFCIFLKGQNVDAELTEATKCWKFGVESHVSASDPKARILRLAGIAENV